MNQPPRHPNYIRNTAGISSVELLWGIGLPLVVESTFLQIFLRSLGASSLVIGSVPAFLFLGQAGFGIISAFFTSLPGRKRTAVILIHCIPAVFLMLYGLSLLVPGQILPPVPLFLVLYAGFAMGIGLVLPVWQNFLISLYPPGTALPALSVMMLAQSAGKLLGGFLLSAVVGRYSLSPRFSGLVFLGCGTLFFAANFFFLLTREDPDLSGGTGGRTEERRSRGSFHRYFAQTLGEIFRNRNFLYYLGSELESFAVAAVLAFYANYATEYRGVSPALAAGGFVAMNYAGQLCVNIFLGILNFMTLRQKAFFSRVLSVSGVLLLILKLPAPVFLVSSLLLGMSRAVRNLIFTPMVKQLSRKADATGYFALAPLLTVGFSSGLPLACGYFLDRTVSSGGGSYRMLFAFLLGLILVSLFFLSRTDFSEPAPAGSGSPAETET